MIHIGSGHLVDCPAKVVILLLWWKMQVTGIFHLSLQKFIERKAERPLNQMIATRRSVGGGKQYKSCFREISLCRVEGSLLTAESRLIPPVSLLR